ncbi:hypothetical protein F5Y04DRAFT_276368 [Hypomontagnella monticulosa]|nr:hypothetical protein F5Y04DRAFT_276368 [Hypomontagnella monticulosa]
MLGLSLVLVLYCGLLVSAREQYARISFSLQKRETASCEQTYGAGSQPCGEAASMFCFNPNLGQSCCATDSGFCGEGKYCAPVAGYCCLEGEDIETCAQNAGFAVPGSASNTSSTAAAGSTLVVTPFLTDAPMPTAVNVQDGADAPCSFPAMVDVANLTTAVPTLVSHTNATTSPIVQMALAAKRDGTFVGPMAMAGMVAILATLF